MSDRLERRAQGGTEMQRSEKVLNVAKAAGEWTVDRVWAVGYLIRLTLASRG